MTAIFRNFRFAIDVYGGQIHLQEYDTGWLMQPEEYETWLSEVLEAVAFITGFAPADIHLKRRERQKGTQQYEKPAKQAQIFIVHEHGRRFWVNLKIPRHRPFSRPPQHPAARGRNGQQANAF